MALPHQRAPRRGLPAGSAHASVRTEEIIPQPDLFTCESPRFVLFLSHLLNIPWSHKDC